jgi:hypothetical protein
MPQVKGQAKFDRGQHRLICKALKVSDNPDAPGDTAYEAVCIMRMKLEMATDFIKRLHTAKSKKLLRLLRKKKFFAIILYGTEA